MTQSPDRDERHLARMAVKCSLRLPRSVTFSTGNGVRKLGERLRRDPQHPVARLCR